MTIAIVDIDTTLADNAHREVLLKHICKKCDKSMEYQDHKICIHCGHDKLWIPQEAWDAFLHPDVILKDTPVEHARDVLNHMRKTGFELHFMTGRNARLYDVTADWLTKNMDWDYRKEQLLVRRNDERSPASVFKRKKFLDTFGHTLQQTAFLFFEDDPHVVQMWKEFGLVIVCPAGWASMNPTTPIHNEVLMSK